MTISLSGLRGLLCFLLPIAIGLAYPCQVLYGSSKAGSISLVLLFLIFGVSLFSKPVKRRRPSKNKSSVAWGWIVFSFISLAIINVPILWIEFGPETFPSLVSALYLATQAGLMYWYFSRRASEREINSFFSGMVVMGLISGGFFIFESINKLAFGQVTQYTRWAHEYTVAQSGADPRDPDINAFRINAGYRSYGLLERHTTSALWMIFGFFAYLFRARDQSKRHYAFSFTLLALLLVQNFTALVCFLGVSLYLYRGIVKLKSMLVSLLTLVPILFFMSLDKITVFLNALSYLMQIQFHTAFTLKTELDKDAYSSIVLNDFPRYGREILERPHQGLLGFGLGSNPFYQTSGDVGFLESMMRLGLPLWICLTWKIYRQMKSARTVGGLEHARAGDDSNTRLLMASAAILASVWSMDFHYSVWIYKTIWPIFFFAMAMARRVGNQTEAALS